MAKRGAFRECDFAIAWHPGAASANFTGVATGLEGAFFCFHGKTSHAAQNPEVGRSALDAVQLMNIGSEFLREHVTDDVRIHYMITHAGEAPNVVPEFAEVKYIIRARSKEAVTDAFDRVVKCAQGAAMMTDTKLEIVRLGGVYPQKQNLILSNIMQELREELPIEEYTEEELRFADELNRTQPGYVEGKTPPITNMTFPLMNVNPAASSDFGDVLHICPGVVNMEVCSNTLSASHTWMVTACAGMGIGMKGMLRAAKVMAGGAYDLICDPEAQKAAKEEFKQYMNGREYIPIPDEIAWPYDN